MQYETTCCAKKVEWSEYLVNHGMCHVCMDTLVEQSNERMAKEENY